MPDFAAVPRHNQDTGYVRAADHDLINFSQRLKQYGERERQAQLRHAYANRREHRIQRRAERAT